MWNKLLAGAALGGVLVFGAALVSKSNSSSDQGHSSASGGAEAFAVISHGEKVSLVEHTDPGGKYTVFLFGADW